MDDKKVVDIEAVDIISDDKKSECTDLRIITNDSASSVSLLQDPQAFKQALLVEQEIRSLLKEYISNNLIEDVDYGRIHIARNCDNFKYGNSHLCPDHHWSKNILFKSGAEKFCNLLNLKCEYEKNQELIDQAPEQLKKVGVIAYTCKLIDKNGNVKAIGNGGIVLPNPCGDKDYNRCIKVGKKRAKIDAVLELGLSDAFTQDEDFLDPDQKYSYDDKPPKNPPNKKPEKKTEPIKYVETKERAVWKETIKEAFQHIKEPTEDQKSFLSRLDYKTDKALKDYATISEQSLIYRAKIETCLKCLNWNEDNLNQFIRRITGNSSDWFTLKIQEKVTVTNALADYVNNTVGANIK